MSSCSDFHAAVKDAEAASFAARHPQRGGRLNAEAHGLSQKCFLKARSSTGKDSLPLHVHTLLVCCSACKYFPFTHSIPLPSLPSSTTTSPSLRCLQKARRKALPHKAVVYGFPQKQTNKQTKMLFWLLLAVLKSKGSLGNVRVGGMWGKAATSLNSLCFGLSHLLNVHKLGKDFQVQYSVNAVSGLP